MSGDAPPHQPAAPPARAGKSLFSRWRIGSVLVIALVLLVSGMGLRDKPSGSPTTQEAALGNSDGRPARDALTSLIGTAQERLRVSPQDWRTWTALGSAYVEQARSTADPSYYDKADGALKRSLSIRSEDNADAEVGLGALANARHDFSLAVDHANRALDLNPFSTSAFGVMTDAHTQLGNYAAASEAVQKMLDLGPGVASFTRASYELEIHGNLEAARDVMQRALETASTPADRAFCLVYLGELAFNSGNLEAARGHYRAARDAYPDYVASLAGRAKTSLATGDTESAINDLTQVIQRVPMPQYVIDLGEIYEATGDTRSAEQQYQLTKIILALFTSSGAADNLLLAQFEAQHGDRTRALTFAQSEWARRKNADVADALAWALHLNGQNTEALSMAKKAAEPGGKNALFFYHRGMIEKALGQDQQARSSLSEALRLNPYFSILHSPKARTALAELGT